MFADAFWPDDCLIWEFSWARRGGYLEHKMGRHVFVILVALFALIPGGQGPRASEHDQLVAKHAAAHGVPESLVRRVIQIESRGNPRVVNSGNYGLMQIRLQTARAMGYGGDGSGLLNADTNMTYAVKYLAGAYRAAGGNSDQAIRNYQRGYYGAAKARGFSPYAVASVSPQAAAPDPTMVPASQQVAVLTAPQPVIDRRAAREQRRLERQAAYDARIVQRQAAQQARVAERQAMLAARAEQREAMLQQKVARGQARQQQRLEMEQAKAAAQASAPLGMAARRAAAAPQYAWYNPMRYFRHPSHQAYTLQRDR